MEHRDNHRTAFVSPYVGADDAPIPPDADDYWYALINETVAAAFQGVTKRKMQKDRQTGDGPKYIRISSRCIRYRRIDLRADAESRMRCSTSDPGPDAESRMRTSTRDTGNEPDRAAEEPAPALVDPGPAPAAAP